MEPFDLNKKRDRDDPNDSFIKEMIDQEKRAKKAKKSVRFQEPAAANKGKTLSEIEDEEGGPVKESMVSMAQTKRRLARKQDDAADSTEFGADTERFEQALEVEEEDGVKFEPFNLKQEREEGYFDEGGNYVERKNDEDDDKDAWLASDGVQVVSDAVREKLQQKQRLLEAAEAAAPLSEVQMAVMKGKMAALMQDGETVMQALKRLGAKQQSIKALSKREKQRLAAQQAANGAAAGTAAADQQQFLQLTELASTLLSAGELDIYGCSKRQLEREAALYAPAAPAAAPTAGGGDMFGDDDDDDMFAEEEKPAAAQQQQPAAAGTQQGKEADAAAATAPPAVAPPAAAAAAAAAAPPPASPAAAAAEPEVDYASWPIKELRRFLMERGQDSSNIVEKHDLVERVRAAAAAGPDGASTQGVPMGYAYDPASGYYYSSEAGMYYDSSSGGFCEAATGKWYVYDSSSQQFVEWGSR